MISYRVSDWEKHYELRDTKRMAGALKWIPVTTKTDGFGFGLIRKQKNAPELLAAWYLMLGVAAKQDRANRGRLVRDGVPLNSDDLELITGFPARIFESAFAFFSNPRQGWLVAEHLPDLPQAAAKTLQQDRTGQDKRGEDRTREDTPASPMPFESSAFSQAWTIWQKHRREIKKPMTATAEQMGLKWCKQIGEARAIAAIENTIRKGWQGLREPDSAATTHNLPAGTNKHQSPASEHHGKSWDFDFVMENERREKAGLPLLSPSEAVKTP